MPWSSSGVILAIGHGNLTRNQDVARIIHCMRQAFRALYLLGHDLFALTYILSPDLLPKKVSVEPCLSELSCYLYIV